jgi:hypothetical protein
MPRPGRFTPGKETRYPLYRRLGGPQDHSGRVRKISPPTGLDPRTVHPVASRYTDWTVPVAKLCIAKEIVLSSCAIKVKVVYFKMYLWPVHSWYTWAISYYFNLTFLFSWISSLHHDDVYDDGSVVIYDDVIAPGCLSESMCERVCRIV